MTSTILLRVSLQGEEQEVKTDLPQRIVALEEQVLMEYIRIAKSSGRKMSPKVLQCFREDVRTISNTIALEQFDADEEFRRWDSLTTQSREADKQLLHLVASQRREQSESLLRATDRSLEVLSITSTLCAEQGKAAS